MHLCKVIKAEETGPTVYDRLYSLHGYLIKKRESKSSYMHDYSGSKVDRARGTDLRSERASQIASRAAEHLREPVPRPPTKAREAPSHARHRNVIYA